MKRKLIMAVAICSLLQPQVEWANETSTQLENVIQIVKEKVEIPSNLSQFSYNLYDDTFNLTWNSKDNKESMDISCEQNGDILSYYYFKDENRGRGSLAEIDVAKAQKIAESFLRKTVPEYAEELTVSNEQTPGIEDDYDFKFYLMHDGVKVYDHVADVSVDKKTGAIDNFNGIKFDAAAKYDSKVPVLTEEKAQALYLSEIGLPLGYQTYSTDENKKQAFLSYYLEDELYGLSAKDGQKVKRYENDPYAVNVKTADAAMGMAREEMELSPQEQQAVDETKGYMSAESIKEKMTAYFPVLGSMTILSTSVQKDSLGSRRYLHMGIKAGNEETAEADLSCDAQTGEIYYYDYYSNDEGQKQQGSKWTNAQADEAIGKISPAQSKQVALASNAMNVYNKNLQEFRYTRIYNGLPVCGDGINVSYNTRLGQITSYNANWSKAEFPSGEGVLSKEDMVKKIGLGLYYMQTGEHNYSLVYATENDNTLFDAFSGKKVDWSGKEIASETAGFYTDIKGHKAENIITKLYNSGIYLEETTLKPDEAITQKELVRLLDQAISWLDDDAKVYEVAFEQGILEENEKAPAQKLTREEGIKYIINATPYKKIAACREIYQYPYKDKDIDENLKGYVTLAYGLNILDHQADKFEPKAELTKADAMVMIYNLLQNN